MSDLTAKQESFVYAFMETGNAAEAYRRSYDVAPDAKDAWIYVAASQLLDNPKVAIRLEEAQEQAKKRLQYNVLTAMSELEEARTLAHGEAQAGAAVSAVNSKIKLLGLDRPKRVEVGGVDGKPIEITLTDTARGLAFILAAAVEEENNG